AVIRRLAGAQSYQRGLDYFSHGHVESLEETADGIRALVRGNQDYAVTLTSDEGVLDYSCDCPIGGDGASRTTAAGGMSWRHPTRSGVATLPDSFLIVDFRLSVGDVPN